jgi:superfamily II helicase
MMDNKSVSEFHEDKIDKSDYKISKCDYCGDKKVKTRATPYMAHILAGADICKRCWDMARTQGLKADEVDIGEFDALKHFPDVEKKV